MSSFSYYLTDLAGTPFAQFWLDAAAKATVLLVAAIAATMLLRRSSAALRHRLWCLTFAALVVLPGLSAALPEWRLAILPRPAPQAPKVVGTLRVPQLLADRRGLSPQVDFPRADSARYDAPLHVETLNPPPTAPAETPTARSPLGLATLWLIGAFFALSPLLIGLARTLLLRRQARPMDDAGWPGLLDELRGRLAMERRVDLLESASALMPMTWGLLRPVVMLPRQARDWTDRLRRFVLLHELAHVKRCDVGFQMLGRLACALYWFHPLAWYALRRLRIERELACDDCVVAAGERATDYAAELLQIARSYRPVPFAAAVAMAQRSNLEHRMRALFDRACSHLPVSARAARLLLAGVLVLVTAVAVVRLAPRVAADDVAQPRSAVAAASPPTDDDPVTVSGRVVDPGEHVTVEVLDRDGKPISDEKTNDKNAEPLSERKAEPPTDSAAATPVEFRGRVVGPDGEDIADARVRLTCFGSQNNDDKFGTHSTTRRDGTFEFRLPADTLFGARRWFVVATKEGYGPGWVDLLPSDRLPDLTVRLARDEAIEGRILDLEGRPVAGMTARVSRFRSFPDDDPRPYLDSLKEGKEFVFKSWPLHLDEPRDSHVIEAVRTDEGGVFRMTGVGINRLAEIWLIGDGTEHALIEVVTHPVENVLTTPDPTTWRHRVYGPRFTHVVRPSRAIVGTVTDAQTDAPIAGARVSSFPGAVSVETDAKGRYTLPGCPKADEYSLYAGVFDGRPYIGGNVTVSDKPGLESLEAELHLYPAVPASGRVIDQVTGRPVAARVVYYPIYPNAHSVEGVAGPGVGAYSEGYTSADGTFSLPVLPGPGCLCVEATGRAAYQPAQVDAAAFFEKAGVAYGRADQPNDKEALFVCHGADSMGAMPQSQFHGVALLNVAEAAETVAQDVEVRSKAQ